jgi:phosphatidylserine decarboxylase
MSAPVDLYLRALSAPATSRLFGRLADARLPGPLLRGLIAAWVRAYGVDMSEAAAPASSFRTFNQFFTRALRPGVRPVAKAADVLVSPCDARVYTQGALGEDGRIDQVKGRTYTVSELLDSAQRAEGFARGFQATLYLSPAMYHRVHWPVDGTIVGWRHIPGRLYPVNALAVRRVDRLFAVNERVAIYLESGFGPLAVVMVGATNVGRISLTFDSLLTNTGKPGGFCVPAEPIPVRRGDELGAFNLGSTVVLLAADARLASAGPGPGDLVRMGEALWRRP